MRTLSASPIDPNNPEGATDLDGFVVDDLESLRQRIQQRLKFPKGTWQLDTRKGTDRLLGFQTPELTASIITNAVLDEGADEVTDVVNVQFRLDHETRRMFYSADVETIYGRMPISTTVI